MNASAIYSKSGKGVQEASGKTSHLARSDRAVLAAIDGRATLADVAQKVGKTFDPTFEKLIESLDKGGFIREVSAGVAAPATAKPAAGKPAAKAAGPVDPASDLDFTTALSIPKSKAPPPAAKATAIPPAPPPPSAAEKAKAEKAAKEQQDAFARAREEAERKAAAERERVKAEAEAKMRVEAEAKARTEAEAKLKAQAEAKAKADAEAKIKAAQEAAARAAAEAKAKAEAEAKKAREEAERIRREAEEKAERARKEAEEKARREHEELKRKLEEERRAREEAERRAKEEAQRLEEERRKLEAERKAREEEKRRDEEERTQRRIQEERERQARRRQEREEEEKPRQKEKAPEAEPEQAPKAAAPAAGGFSDALLADLESFTTRDDQEQKEREEALRKEKEAAAQAAAARAEAERKAAEERTKEEAAHAEREAKQRRKQEEADRKAREEAGLRERAERDKQRLKEEEEKRRKEAEEREKKAKQEEQLAAKATRASGSAYDAGRSAKRERELMSRSRTGPAAARGERKGWGRPIAATLFVLLVIALGVAHVMPIDTTDYERAASEALGRPVKIGSARLSLFTGLQVKLRDVRLGEGVILPEVSAYPELDAVLGPRKAFKRIEFERVKIEQDALGQALFVKLKGGNFSVGRVAARNVELAGPLALPKGLEFELAYDAEGVVRSAVVRGPEALLARLSAKGTALEFDMSAASFVVPFAPEISLSKFSAKGTASAQGLQVAEWDGALLNGTLSGTANVRWGESWVVDGVVTARNINAAVFAPALLSDGKGEGSGKFLMRGPPGKLAATSRLDGSFTVTRGVLGSIDLSRAIQTGGKQATGRTQFNEMNGQGTYDRGAVALRNVTIGAGQLNAGASADIAQNGALSGRIVADVKVAQQRLSATLNLGGTVKEPQVRN